MSRTSFLLDDVLDAYVKAHNPQPDDVVRDLMTETAALERANMAVAVDQASFLALLVSISGARRIIEIGTFTGLSSLAMARALPDDGTLLACDISEEWTAIARRHWERAGVAHKIELRIGPALHTLGTLSAIPTFDFAFLDAEKTEYPRYLEEAVPRLRTGGLLVADNVLWDGAVANPDAKAASTQALQRFNDLAAADARLETHLLAIHDGLLIARKR